MQLTAIIVLALSTGAHAWTNGVANDDTEACTIENTDQKLQPGDECSFFVDAVGGINHGSEYLPSTFVLGPILDPEMLDG